MTSPGQKRRHARLHHQATVQLEYAGETVTGVTRDISESGLLVEAVFVRQPAVGDRMEVLVLDIPDGVKRPVVIRRLIDEPHPGFAVEFV